MQHPTARRDILTGKNSRIVLHELLLHSVPQAAAGVKRQRSETAHPFFPLPVRSPSHPVPSRRHSPDQSGDIHVAVAVASAAALGPRRGRSRLQLSGRRRGRGWGRGRDGGRDGSRVRVPAQRRHDSTFKTRASRRPARPARPAPAQCSCGAVLPSVASSCTCEGKKKMILAEH